MMAGGGGAPASKELGILSDRVLPAESRYIFTIMDWRVMWVPSASVRAVVVTASAEKGSFSRFWRGVSWTVCAAAESARRKGSVIAKGTLIRLGNSRRLEDLFEGRLHGRQVLGRHSGEEVRCGVRGVDPGEQFDKFLTAAFVFSDGAYRLLAAD